MTLQTLTIQSRLASLGYDPGPLDGIRGRRTIGALRAFQRDRGLVADGLFGPATRARLLGEETGLETNPDLPWYAEARRLMGTREVPGPGSNSVIENWADALGLPYRGDDIPWCGLFVAHCIGAALPDEPLPANPLGARNWIRFGQTCEPGLGSVLVFWRESRASGKGHVGFYTGEDAEGFYVLGGNQSDAVNVKRLAKRQFIGARWPAGTGVPAPRRVRLDLGSNAFETALA